MAVARKVIVLDFKHVSPEYVYATAALIFALSFAYWITVRLSPKSIPPTDL